MGKWGCAGSAASLLLSKIYPKATLFSSFYRFCGAASGRFAQKYIPLHKIGGGSAIKTSFIALTLHYLCKKYNNTMIRSIPNPPMDRVDVTRFRQNLEKHLRGDFNAEERHHIEARQARTKANAQRIIENCGGKNPLLGY